MLLAPPLFLQVLLAHNIVVPIHGFSQLNQHQQQRYTININTSTRSSAILTESSFLGKIYRIEDEQDEDSTSFLAQSAVPTFATFEREDNKDDAETTRQPIRYRGLEGALRVGCDSDHDTADTDTDDPSHGPAFCLDHVLSKCECQDLLAACESLGFGNYNAGKNRHGALQLVVSQQLADTVAQRMAPYINIAQVQQLAATIGGGTLDIYNSSLVFAGLNRRWRVYRYAPGGHESFAPHVDAAFPPSGLCENGNRLVWDCNHSSENPILSRLTVLFYLNDDFCGGETKFYEPLSISTKTTTTTSSSDSYMDGSTMSVIASVRPVAGSCLVFPQGVGQDGVAYARQHWPLHEGSPVGSGSKSPKYVVRSDVLFATVPNSNDNGPALDDDDDSKLFQYDGLVRQAFLPTSSVFDQNFLSHVESLYNPHMGVENTGPFLYSFLRLTKKRRVVEIGAGYTSVWILQALADNDVELNRIRTLNRNGKCRLLDYPFCEPLILEHYDAEPARLLCIDNCEHQKETATGAAAVAKTLGLSKYMEFVKGDAFEILFNLNNNNNNVASVDVLWCDFGVGSRMRDFVRSAWFSLRPGGYLLCHSTLTNRRTRDWLEATRRHDGIETTGLPPNEYLEVSLLEPHKHFQNSISIFQKRTQGYAEPIYSEYA